MRVLQRSLVLLMSASSLAGCAVGPNYHRPAIASASAYMGSPAVAARSQAAPITTDSWWAGFGDPVLSDLVMKALDQNLDIAQAVARVSQAKASLRAADAALLPSASVSASAATAHQSLETPTGRMPGATPGFDRDGQLYDASLGASWEIDLFGGLRRGGEAARADYQASQAGVAAARLSVAAQVADTYIVIRGLQARLSVAEQQVSTQRRLVDTVRLQYDKGVAAELQLRQAEGALTQVEASVPVLRIGLEAAMNALDILLGAQPGTYRQTLAAVTPIPDAPAIGETGAPADLLRRRPDLIIAERKLAASNARIGVAVSEYFPKFSIGGLIGSATTVAGNMFTGVANQAQGVLGLRWRLFDFGRVDAEIAAAKGANAEALAAYRLAVLRASEDVENAFSALVQREAQEATLARGEIALTRAQSASLAAYKGGVVSLIEVLDADRRLLDTRDARVQAQAEAARAAVASFRALGGGWQGAA
ncbi:efflux transporter outer membrane subunit [Sphingobium phenoxybenzoativorans]|uniref:Efflux transporter outer membrane subunit n=1 Tax=Sphingobium phenoxybenzoativorans TaxID=1592790 RepID=A0A975Q157_9SPHN|nr:efflux transporter outer membrane subunit [Sphingobium phenoxybenzoativorans]QUT05590.1 efflux transporter outer membrane subunit [Sphingobium phenoxybenzoativorans]